MVNENSHPKMERGLAGRSPGFSRQCSFQDLVQDSIAEARKRQTCVYVQQPRRIARGRTRSTIGSEEALSASPSKRQTPKGIDTEVQGAGEDYELQGVREGTTNIYRDATFKTGGFKLSAPKIEISETKDRVKVIVLAKLKQ